MASAASADSIRSQLDTRPLAEIVSGDPELVEIIREQFPDLLAATDAVPLTALLPNLAAIPAAEKFPRRQAVVSESSSEPAAPTPPTAPIPWSCSEDGIWGSAYAALAAILERSKTRILADVAEGTAESIKRAEQAAISLVSVGRLFKHVEPRRQFRKLAVPGHEELIGFALSDLLRAGARVNSPVLADTACKLLVGATFDRLCNYGVASDFPVRKCRGYDESWNPPPADADLYGIGCALLGPEVSLAALRVLLMLTSAERWLAAQVAVGLLGTAVVAAPDDSYLGPAAPSPLRHGIARCISDSSVGELHGVMAALVLIALNARCEHAGALLRCGLGATLVRGWRERQRPVMAGLCAFALADLCEEAHAAHYAPWDLGPRTEEEIMAAPVPAREDADAWRQQLRRSSRAHLRMKDEHAAGAALFTAELLAEGVALPAPRRMPRPQDPVDPAAAQVESDRQQAEREAQDASARASGLEVPPTAEEGAAMAWAGLPAELAAQRVDNPQNAWADFCKLSQVLEEHYKPALEANEPGLYNEFG